MKKENQALDVQVVNSEPVTAQDAIAVPEITYNNRPPRTFTRNEFGLLEKTDYKFNDDGTVNWRAMIPVEFLYLNPQHTERIEKKYKKKVSEISILDDKVDDVDLVAKIGAFKYLASLRGYSSVDYQISNSNENYASVVCAINWIPNYENAADYLCFGGLGSATAASTNQMTRNYLVEMAENRAFCRAVRSFLRINVVSNEELVNGKAATAEATDSNSVASSGQILPKTLLYDVMKEKGISFDKVKASLLLRAKTDEEKNKIKAYESLDDIPNSSIFDVLGRIKKSEENGKL